jgi:ATP-dependent RNA helicase DDX51/DBP6
MTSLEKDWDIKEDNVWIMGNKRLPLRETSLHPKIIEVLEKSMNITELFPVQRAVIPAVISMTQSQTPGDICICSTTGSGKTLAYVLPIEQCCIGLKLTKLRAIIVIPSKTLGRQVFNIFKQFSKVTSINVELCGGNLLNFEQEQKKIITQLDNGTYASLVHVIISTPNCLLRHIRETKGFLSLLTSLKFIVLDEVDTMLDKGTRGDLLKRFLMEYEEQFQLQQRSSLLDSVTNIPFPIPSIRARKILCSATLTPHAGRLSKLNLHRPQFFTSMHTYTPLAPQLSNSTMAQEETKEIVGDMEQSNMQGKIMQDDEVSRDQKYSVPDTLRQYVSVYEPYFKPLYLMALLLHPNLQLFTKQRKILCFCDNTGNANRLNMMLNSFLNTGAWQRCIEINEQMVLEKRRAQKQAEIDVYQGMATPTENYKISAVYDSKMRSKDRNKLINDFHNGFFSVLICTDILGRGLDLQVDTVINYDTPTFLKTYMHRVGRTARAGKHGVALTMVEAGELDIFKQKLTKRVSMKEPVTDYSVSTRVISQMKPLYKEVLANYKHNIKAAST